MHRAPSPKRSAEVTRRAILQYLGAGAALAVGSGALEGCGAATDGLEEHTGATASGLIEWSSPTDIVRPDDLLVLTVSFANLAPGAGNLVRTATGDAYLRVDLPPQAIVEDAYTPLEAFPKIVGSQLAAKSRIVVRVPRAFQSAPFTIATLIDLLSKGDLVVHERAKNLRAPAPALGAATLAGWSGFNAAVFDRLLRDDEIASSARHRLRVSTLVARATGTPVSAPGTPAPAPDDGSFTAIEMPHRLRLSPGPTAAWGAAAAPVVSPLTGRVEVWSTYLGARDPETQRVEESAEAMLLGAVAARPGPESTSPPLPVRYALPSNAQRARIVEQTTGPNGRAAQARQVILSSLGGTLDVRGDWPGETLASWTHKIAGGRELFVELVTTGWLLPFGHKATVLNIAQRSEDPTKQVGSLRRWDVLIVKKPLVTFGAATNTTEEKRLLNTFPFEAVKLQETRVLLQPLQGATVTWIQRLGTQSAGRFPFVGYDKRGRPIHLDTRLYFFTANTLAAALAAFKTETFHAKGQKIAYAPSRSDDTSFETHTLSMNIVSAPGRAVAALPVVHTLEAVIDAVERLGGPKKAVYRIADEYRQNAFAGANGAAKTLLEAAQTMAPIDVGAKTDGAAGLVNPKVAYDTISKKAGPTARAALSAAHGFDPAKGLAGIADLKLFGVFTLDKVLKVVGNDVIGGDPMRFAPRFVTDALHEGERIVATVANVVHTMVVLRQHGEELTRKAQNKAASVQAKVVDVVTRAKAVYDAAAAIMESVEAGDFDALPARIRTLVAAIGTKPPAPGQAGTGLLGALHALADSATRLSSEDAVEVIDGIFEEATRALETAAEVLDDVDRVMRILAGAQKGLEAARDLALKIEWRPRIGSFASIFFPESEYGLSLAIEIRQKAKNGKPAGTDLMCRLDKFALRFGLDTSTEAKSEITAKFKRFVLKRDAGKKPDVDIVFDGLHFGGKLRFVETLRNLIPLDGFSDPPYLDITATGIVAGFTVAIPAIAVGLFSIENIILGAELTVPFVGEAPVFSFKFSDKDNPFLVTYAMFGGGGYFRIELDPKGFKRLELSICVGAQLALNLGVASGAVSIFAGITMTYDVQEGVLLTAFVRMHGHLQVLGLISISVDLTMSLSYDGCKLTGVAELKVEVEVLFFSKTVKLRFERTFVGANADPTLSDVMAPYRVDDVFAETPMLMPGGLPNVFPFYEYCEAFA